MHPFLQAKDLNPPLLWWIEHLDLKWTVPLLKLMRSQVPVSSSRLSVKWIYQLMIWDASLILETWKILWEQRRELEISNFRDDSTTGNIPVWRASRKLIIFWDKRSKGGEYSRDWKDMVIGDLGIIRNLKARYVWFSFGLADSTENRVAWRLTFFDHFLDLGSDRSFNLWADHI